LSISSGEHWAIVRLCDGFEPKFKDRSIIGDAENQARLRASWARLIQRLAELAPMIEREQQNVRRAASEGRTS
jgi:hypothetical protein